MDILEILIADECGVFEDLERKEEANGNSSSNDNKNNM